MLATAFNHLLRFHPMCSAEEVSDLINRPVVRLFGPRVSGTRAKVVTQTIYLKFPATTSCERLLRNRWDLGTHGGGEESLPETSRQGFISTVRPDLPQPTHGFKEEDTLGGTLFLRLKTSHLRPKYGLLDGSHYALL